MPNLIDEVLERNGLKYSQLNPHEREYLNTWLTSFKTESLTIPKVQQYVSGMRAAIEQELTSKSETPQSWMSVLSLLIPLVGIVRKWYQDQRKVELQARLRNYMLLEALLTAPDKAQQEMERAVAAFATNIK